MYLNNSLRHFDRGSGLIDSGQYDKCEFVFGGTGACLALTRECIVDVSFKVEDKYEEDLWSIYPQNRVGYTERVQLFDEAFFAYREDADLAWRMNNLGWKTLYIPEAFCYHKRVVTPERRKTISKEINLLGVRNRFLLQLNNYFISNLPQAFLPGIILRNIFVIISVILCERSSLPGLFNVFTLYRRSYRRRMYIKLKMKSMNFDLKNILITGATSGIGEQFAKRFHSLGANIVITGRREDRLIKLSNELNAKRPDSCKSIKSDLFQKSDLISLKEYIESNDIDYLINNAGRGSFNYFEKNTLSDEIDMLYLNIHSYVTLSHAIIPKLKVKRGGGIVFVSSLAAFQPLPYMAIYGATKSFNFSFSEALRHELKQFNIRVLAVCPGPVDTEFAGVARVPGGWSGVKRNTALEVVNESINALIKNKSFVVPCTRAKIAYYFCKFLPVSINTYFTEKILKSTLDKSNGNKNNVN